MNRVGQPERPAIEVNHSRTVNAEVLRQLCAGIEEEGVPHVLVPRSSELDAVAAAARGAERSMLDVGIGLGDNGAVAIAQSSFPADQPVLRSEGQPSPDLARRLGQNAARMVTRLPLELSFPPPHNAR